MTVIIIYIKDNNAIDNKFIYKLTLIKGQYNIYLDWLKKQEDE